jgi:uncharacterized protein
VEGFAIDGSTLALLCAFAFLAGLLDAIVGGGGLIQIPALFILLPGVPPATLFGTNKFASIWGTAMAFVQYRRTVPFSRTATLPTALTAVLGGFLGARLVAHIPPELLRPALLVLLGLVLAYTLWNKNFGALHAPRLSPRLEVLVGLATGSLIGFYDGFFGPGTGSFLIFAFVGLFGFSFLAASAAAKLVNVITNAGALAYFLPQDHVLYRVALPMAVCNLVGGYLGARLAIARGSAFVRLIFLVVVGALLLRFAHNVLITAGG